MEILFILIAVLIVAILFCLVCMLKIAAQSEKKDD